ncbi:MAG: hypothetical protein ACKV2T_31925 [Kofleriaceae bacterium]
MQVPRKESVAGAVEVLGEQGTDLAAVDRAIEFLVQNGAGSLHGESLAVLCHVTARRSGRAHNSLEDAVGWIVGQPGGASLARLVLNAGEDDPLLAAMIYLVVARRLARNEGTAQIATFSDAPVVSLDRFLIEEWKRNRAKSPHEWLYHPRRTSISGLVVKKLLSDLIVASSILRSDAESGRIACDLNVEFATGGRNKTLDCVLGRPREALGEAIEPQHPLRKARLGQPLITVEVKACMTSHRQANSRLIDELHSSVEVVKGHSPRVIPVAIVIVNVSPTFTNPLNLPGPNKHVAVEIARVFERVVQRVQLDRGSGADVAYGGLGLVVVDTDNEKRIREASRESRVPPSHTYERTVGRAAALYERMVNEKE